MPDEPTVPLRDLIEAYKTCAEKQIAHIQCIVAIQIEAEEKARADALAALKESQDKADRARNLLLALLALGLTAVLATHKP